jgi:antitoxin component YwqK of YwqJK toxin-antitoxin module
MMTLLSRYLLLITFSFSFFPIWAQRCEFSYYYKKGSVYFFSTYLEGVNQPRQGECIYQDEQGRIYQKRLFKNGIIQEEYTIHFESQKPNTIYHRIDKDTLIGKAQYFDVLGRITQEVVYYWGIGNRRAWTQTDYQLNGRKRRQASYVMIPLSELLANGFAMPPEHIIDAEGYADDIVPYGWDLEFHENGKLKSKKFHRFIVAENGDLEQYSLEGRVEEFYDNGQKRLSGYYKDGNPDSLWQYYFPNGKVSGVKQFRNNLGYGVWREYHPNGITSFETTYNEDIYDPFTPHVKQFNENGVLVSEKWIQSNGKGFLREYLDNGQLIKEEIYEHGPREVAKQRKFYKNGQLQLLSYMRPINDTSMVTYYENGQVETFVSNGIHRTYQEQFFPNGKPRMRFESVNFLGQRQSSHDLYQENGNLLQSMRTNQDTTIQTHYFLNGQMKQTFRREKTLLQGNYLEWDSLGKPLTQLVYHNGIRSGVGLVKKRTPRTLSRHEEINLENWWLACLENAHRADSPNAEPYFLSKDSIQVYLEVLQAAMEYMPEEWKAEIPLVSNEQGRKFIYRFVLKDNTGDSLSMHWMAFCKSQGWKMVKEDPMNGAWKSGDFETSDFFGPEWIKQHFKKNFPNSVLDVQIMPRWVPNGEARVLESDKRRYHGASTVDLVITRLSNVALMNWNTPWGARNFTFYGDDIEPFNRFFDWDIPQSSGFELPWD